MMSFPVEGIRMRIRKFNKKSRKLVKRKKLNLASKRKAVRNKVVKSVNVK